MKQAMPDTFIIFRFFIKQNLAVKEVRMNASD